MKRHSFPFRKGNVRYVPIVTRTNGRPTIDPDAVRLNYQTIPVPELRNMAASRGVHTTSKMRKADIIDALVANLVTA